MATSTSSISRRSFVAGALATAGMLALCGNARAGFASEATDESTVTNATYDGDTSAGVAGGTLYYYLTNPTAIEPFGAEENQGYEVMSNLYDTLLDWDFSEGKIVPLAAESYEVNDTADVFTFHLRKDATFHDGSPVRAQDFVYSWNRICKPDFKPAPSSIGYKIAQVKGYDEMTAGEADSLDIEATDDYTFVVNLKSPFADFDIVTVDQALAPVPEGCTDTEEDYQAFRVHPIGNGPFQMDGDWVDGQYINLKPYDGYWGEKPFIDGIAFQIFKDDTTAWTEFQAGNLDFTSIPSGQITVATATYGEAGCDGYVANPGAQVFNGEETSVYYLLCNNNDEIISNADVRRAISCAVNRTAIATTAFEGTRSPADNILMPAVPGYGDSVWPDCPAEPDLEKAAAYFDAAGYPLDENGSRNLSITLSTNSGSGNETTMQLIQADLANMGVDVEIEVQEWAAYIDNCQSFNYQIGRMGWIITVPQQYSILHDLFYTGGGNNNSGYSNEEFDEAIDEAVTILDKDERVAAFVKANEIVANDFPVIPLLFYRHYYVASNRVNNMFLPAGGIYRLTRCWLSA